MDQQLVELVTKLVVEKLGQQADPPKQQIKVEHTSTPTTPSSLQQNALIQLFGTEKKPSVESHSAHSSEQATQPPPIELKQSTDEKFAHAVSKTPARIAVGRTGSRPLTTTVLNFRLDHAAAVDAVHGEVNQAILDELNLFTVHTNAKTDKETYILRPDFGRKLTDESKQVLSQKATKHAEVQIIVSNGLSASAINANLINVFRSLEQSLQSLQLQLGEPFYIEQGRVGLMDDIGELLKPEVVVYLIGERPGLVSAESMSAYICYQPRHGTIESDRTVVSNIHKGGIPPVEAGAYLGNIIQKILKYKASGVNLVKIED
ncbi:MAG: ethanolamine ammonia-lyase subunit EutC [Lysinibacillus sp.]